MGIYNRVDSIRFLKRKILPLTMISLLAVPAWAAGPETNPDRWVLGEFLLVGFLVLFVLGWLTGAYGFLLAGTGPLFRRIFLYPLLNEDREKRGEGTADQGEIANSQLEWNGL